jgi:predicted nuclease with TOPRIM domain
MEGGERMIGEKTIIPADVIPESDIAPIMRRANELKEENEKLKEKNEYLQKEVEDAKAVGGRALCEVQELIEKNKRLVEEHNRQNGTIQALNIALDVITDRYSNLRKRLCRTDKGGE